MKQYLHNIRAVKASDVRAAAQKYLTSKRLAISLVTPQ
jgi:predicted Zn-dependent peptidase